MKKEDVEGEEGNVGRKDEPLEEEREGNRNVDKG
jgi:hypothetical protein